MGSGFEGQLAFALVLPLLLPIIGTMLYVNLAARTQLRRERAKYAAMFTITQGRRIR